MNMDDWGCPCADSCCDDPHTYTADHECDEGFCEECYCTECSNCGGYCCCDL